MLKVENIKLPPGADMGALSAETARILKVREKDLLSLRVLRRSVDAREGVSMVYTVEADVKNEADVLKRCHKKVTRMERTPGYLLPAPLPAPAIPPVVVGAGPGGRFAALVLARAGLRPSCWSGAVRWSGGKRTWTASGPRGSWTPPATSSSARAAPGPFPTVS